MFLRGIGTMAPDEHIIYNYWLITLSLLELGIPWESIKGFSSDEIAIVLAINLAKKERQSEQENRQQSFAQLRR